MFKPSARTNNFTIRQWPDETLVYDHQTNKGHCLNATAALVWKYCDGTATVAELARRVGQPAAVVELALEQLGRRNLLAQPVPELNPSARLARRAILKKLAVAATLPLILSVTANRAHASSKGTCFCTCPSKGAAGAVGGVSSNNCARGRAAHCDFSLCAGFGTATCQCL